MSLLVPVTFLESPTIAVVNPVVVHPVMTVTLVDEMAFHPDMMTMVPPPVAGRPHIARAGRRRRFNAIGRRRDLNVDISARLGQTRHAACAEHQQRADERFTCIHVTS